jgi:hypothetical protein
MKREKTIYEGVVISAIIILVVAHFIGLCVNGLCTQDWLIKNLVLCAAIILFFFVYLHKQIRTGGLILYRETANLGMVVNYYQRIRTCSTIGVFYAIAYSFLPDCFKQEAIKGNVITILIILFVSLSVFFTTTADISRIKNRRS